MLSVKLAETNGFVGWLKTPFKGERTVSCEWNVTSTRQLPWRLPWRFRNSDVTRGVTHWHDVYTYWSLKLENGEYDVGLRPLVSRTCSTPGGRKFRKICGTHFRTCAIYYLQEIRQLEKNGWFFSHSHKARSGVRRLLQSQLKGERKCPSRVHRTGKRQLFLAGDSSIMFDSPVTRWGRVRWPAPPLH